MVHLKRFILTAFVLLSGLAFGAFLANSLIPAPVIYYDDYRPITVPKASTTTAPDYGEEDTSSSSQDTVTSEVMCTMDARLCPDGSYVGRIGPTCEFAACPGGEANIPPEILCSDEMKQADACIEIYAPVCAAVTVECVTTPCDPIPETFPNSCFACSSGRVESYIEGECPISVIAS